jgi:hypothetical protein
MRMRRMPSLLQPHHTTILPSIYSQMAVLSEQRVRAVQSGVLFASIAALVMACWGELGGADKNAMAVLLFVRAVDVGVLACLPGWRRSADGLCLALWISLIAFEVAVAVGLAPLGSLAMRMLRTNLIYAFCLQEALYMVSCAGHVGMCIGGACTMSLHAHWVQKSIFLSPHCYWAPLSSCHTPRCLLRIEFAT